MQPRPTWSHRLLYFGGQGVHQVEDHKMESEGHLFPWRAYVRFSQPDPEISTGKFLELAKK